MAIRDILVTLDTTPAARGRIELAATLASRCDAHLVGLHTTPLRSIPRDHAYFQYFDRYLLALVYAEFEEKMRADAELTHREFDEITNRRGLAAEWREATGDPTQSAALHGRYVDLIVLGQVDPDDVLVRLFRSIPEEVAFMAGRPLLVVPYAGNWSEIGMHVLVAWDASREAARAINDAMPLLLAAERVTVLAVDPAEGPAGHGQVPGADIALHLARHGVTATVETAVSAGIGIGNTLLSRANDLEADLLVMGAYGHSRVRELVLGGATRTVLESMTLPVLLSH